MMSSSHVTLRPLPPPPPPSQEPFQTPEFVAVLFKRASLPLPFAALCNQERVPGY